MDLALPPQASIDSKLVQRGVCVAIFPAVALALGRWHLGCWFLASLVCNMWEIAAWLIVIGLNIVNP